MVDRIRRGTSAKVPAKEVSRRLSASERALAKAQEQGKGKQQK
jgi:hypothetical protein